MENHPPKTLPLIIGNVPAGLDKKARRWVAWKWQFTPGKGGHHNGWDKIPINPNTGQNARNNDPSTFGTFDEAVSFYKKHNLAGIGYELIGLQNFIGLDLDNCRNPSNGEIATWAKQIVEKLKSYWEISPSGTGIRGFAIGQRHGNRVTSDLGSLFYGQPNKGTYLTITGHKLNESTKDIQEDQASIDATYKVLFPHERREPSIPAPTTPTIIDLDDQEIIKRARVSKNGQKFERLYRGEWQGSYPSQSEADYALMRSLYFWTGGDPRRMEDIFSASGLGQRDKWHNREDYRRLLIENVFEAGGRVYTWQKKTHRQLGNEIPYVHNEASADEPEATLTDPLANEDIPTDVDEPGEPMAEVEEELRATAKASFPMPWGILPWVKAALVAPKANALRLMHRQIVGNIWTNPANAALKKRSLFVRIGKLWRGKQIYKLEIASEDWNMRPPSGRKDKNTGKDKPAGSTIGERIKSGISAKKGQYIVLDCSVVRRAFVVFTDIEQCGRYTAEMANDPLTDLLKVMQDMQAPDPSTLDEIRKGRRLHLVWCSRKWSEQREESKRKMILVAQRGLGMPIDDEWLEGEAKKAEFLSTWSEPHSERSMDEYGDVRFMQVTDAYVTEHGKEDSLDRVLAWVYNLRDRNSKNVYFMTKGVKGKLRAALGLVVRTEDKTRGEQVEDRVFGKVVK